MFMFFLLTLTCCLMLIFLKHPLSCGLILLIQTILVSLMSGLMNLNYWFSYILFLIMIGGMLILFIYMTSIASNEKFKFNSKLFIIFMISILLTLIFLFIDPFYLNKMNQLMDMKSQNYIYIENFSMIKYLNFPNNMMMILMIIYLLITLIAIVKITNLSYGSLRQNF
uniref:NADH-ubiquinone oxidoreductase chain 6 n=1 Tax=Aulacophora indica TaxID=217245 RepID=A0A6H1YDG5_9CUCU|nr:NADH dehydrogenase subunit 6 [Aulacophora indica]QJA26358.1 NADH dehydrogenase subunit 6 [Aulacophora indica]QRI59123.1 NADH dehydrogenase subunit 6 [Aulacophora indica]